MRGGREKKRERKRGRRRATGTGWFLMLTGRRRSLAGEQDFRALKKTVRALASLCVAASMPCMVWGIRVIEMMRLVDAAFRRRYVGVAGCGLTAGGERPEGASGNGSYENMQPHLGLLLYRSFHCMKLQNRATEYGG